MLNNLSPSVSALGNASNNLLLANLQRTGASRQLLEVIENLQEFISTLWQTQAGLNNLSQNGGEGILRSLLLQLITGGIGELGIAVDKVLGFKQLLLDAILHEIALWSGITTGSLPAATLGVLNQISNDRYRQDIVDWVDAFLRGKAIANGPRTELNPTRSGDPVLIHRGEFERVAVDLHVGGAGMDFEFTRTYRSAAVYLGPLGPGWDHSYNLRLREENMFSLVRMTGRLSEEQYVRHPRFGDAEYTYYTPPDGIHDVIVPDGGTSFMLLRAQGVTYRYESTPIAGEHRVRRIEDRFGNYLDFEYSLDDLLDRVFVNSQHRYVDFRYHELGHLAQLQDHTGRVVSYDYDNTYLDCAAGPTLLGERASRLERYEYSLIGVSHKLVRVWDWKGRIAVENEYQTNPFSEFFGYLIRQRLNLGESTYAYESLPPVSVGARVQRDTPRLRVWESRRNGHQIEHVLNGYGNELKRREMFVDGGRYREVLTLSRYNSDGQLIARLAPDGVLSQFLFGREQMAELLPWPEISHVISDVRLLDRMAFGNLLATVTRGRRVASSAAATDPSFWQTRVPPVKQREHADDVVVKISYARETQLVVSNSDPRFSVSADPSHVESAPPGETRHDPTDRLYVVHQRHLTRFEYGPGPRFELRKTVLPNRNRPSVLDGVGSITGIDEAVVYDNRGRPVEHRDPLGYRWFHEYYPASNAPALRAKEGFLRRSLAPHVDWTLTEDALELLEVELHGVWRARANSLISSGVAGEYSTIVIRAVRIELFQSKLLTELLGANPQVMVSVDGSPKPSWDQTKDPSYVLEGLAVGQHTVEIRDSVGMTVSLGRIRSHVAAEFEVDDLGRTERELDYNGNERSYELDAMGRASRVTKGLGVHVSVVDRSHDPLGNVVYERHRWRDEQGHVLQPGDRLHVFEYDQIGQVRTSAIGAERRADQRVVRHRYDAEDRRRETIGTRGVRTRIEYDQLGRPIRTIRGACTPVAVSTSVHYDLAGRILIQISPRGAYHAQGFRDRERVLQTGYDASGHVRVTTDPMGHMDRIDYDKLGNQVVHRRFQRRNDGQFELLSRTATEYDENGDRIRETTAVFDTPILTSDPVTAADAEFERAFQAGAVKMASTEFHLDALGRPVAIIDPTGIVERQQFDGQGRLVAETDAVGNRTFRILDGNGNVVRHYIFDPVLDPGTGKVTDKEVFVTDYVVDAWDRERVRIDGYGNRWEQHYDTLGNVTRAVDPLGNIVRFEYNVFGEEIRRIEERTDTGTGAGAATVPVVTETYYDRGGNVVMVEDASRRRTVYVYDTLDRNVSTRYAGDPNEPAEVRTYDEEGNARTLRDQNGLIRTMTYDLLNRMTSSRIDTRGVAPQHALSPAAATFEIFRYDANGEVTHHENDFCVVAIRYDSRGLPLSEAVRLRGIAGAPGPQNIDRYFDLVGLRTRLIYPSRRETSINYDPIGRVQRIRHEASLAYPGRATLAAGFDVADYRYIGDRLSRINYGNQLSLHIRHDGRGNPFERSVVRQDGRRIWRSQGVRDAAGYTRMEIATLRSGRRARKYSLDSLYQIVDYEDRATGFLDPSQITPPNTPIAPSANNTQIALNNIIGPLNLPARLGFTYDDQGNRTNTDEPGRGTFNSVPNSLNQYDMVGGVHWNHDLNGNLRDDGAHQLEYDADNLLAGVQDRATGRQKVTYYRDALGRVIAEQTPQDTRFRIYDGAISLVDWTANSRSEYTADPIAGAVIHVAKDGEDYWVTGDGLGSLRLLTDGAGTPVSMPSYRPFGASEDAELSLSPLSIGFGGMWYTSAAPYLQSPTRSYRADVGRYLQRDPGGLQDGPNPYVYAGNNPVDKWDPTGLEDEFADSFLTIPERQPYSLFGEDEFQLVVDWEALTAGPDLGDYAGAIWYALASLPEYNNANYYYDLASRNPWYSPVRYANEFVGMAWGVLGTVELVANSLLGVVGAGFDYIDPYNELPTNLIGTGLPPAGALGGSLSLMRGFSVMRYVRLSNSYRRLSGTIKGMKAIDYKTFRTLNAGRFSSGSMRAYRDFKNGIPGNYRLTAPSVLERGLRVAWNDLQWSQVNKLRLQGFWTKPRVFGTAKNMSYEHFFIKQRHIKKYPILRGFGNSYANTFLRIPKTTNNLLDKSLALEVSYKSLIPASGAGGYLLGKQVVSE